MEKGCVMARRDHLHRLVNSYIICWEWKSLCGKDVHHVVTDSAEKWKTSHNRCKTCARLARSKA